MVKHNQSPTQHQQFVKVRGKPLKRPSIEITGFGDESGVQILCRDNKNVNKQMASQSSEMLSTAELISAVGQIWDCASRSLARFQPRGGPDCFHAVRAKDNAKCYLVENEDTVGLKVKDSGYLHFDLNLSRNFPCIVQKSLKCLRLTQKISYLAFEDHTIQNFLSKSCDGSCAKNYVWLKEDTRMNKDGWVSNPPGEHLMSSSRESPNIIQSFTSEAVMRFSPEYQGLFFSLFGTKNPHSCLDTSSIKDLVSGGIYVDLVNRRPFMSSLYLDYILQDVLNRHDTTSFRLWMKSYASNPKSGCSHEANNHLIETDELVGDEMIQCEESKTLAEFQSESSSPVTNKAHPLLARQEHAVSGAMAGIFVSLCLHPIDTIKTVVQSCQAGQKSLCYIGQSLISERGLLGLYRGLSSNITTSAPISALYTFTYESVKGFLLPSLTKEYHSIAHCAAGACASIATSFIFTPSEHIKQQMQVNSKYLSCWNAAVKIIEKGGLLSLYAGWGAVLCRNIPHSIIKFYTYETLKQMFMSSELPNRQPKTLQTLLCGGLAGSAAALFSTPFDVVKTRLQTQMPGSARKYHNILNVLQHIHKHEGVNGLYRGLVPRLVMYMSQGALFFASYEFFKEYTFFGAGA